MENTTTKKKQKLIKQCKERGLNIPLRKKEDIFHKCFTN